MIPLYRITVDEDVKQAVIHVLDSGRYVLGEQNRLFEREFSRYINVKYAVSTSSGTSALYLILRALGIGRGDEVIVPSYTFIASVTPILMVDAKPVFIDVDYDTMTIDIEKIKKAITDKTKAIIPVHLFGHPAYMDAINEIADERGIYVIEDAAEAHGAEYKGDKVGSLGYAAFFSFYPTKNLTVYGDGGIVVTNDEEIADKVRLLRHHGQIDKDKYIMLGYNMKMSEIHAAIGRIELKKLDRRNEIRRKFAKIYNETLGNYVDLPIEKNWAKHVYHLYTIKCKHRDALANYLRRRGIETGIYYKRPVNKYNVFPSQIRKMKYPISEMLSKKVLSIPISHNHTEDEIYTVSEEIKKFMKKL